MGGAAASIASALASSHAQVLETADQGLADAEASIASALASSHDQVLEMADLGLGDAAEIVLR